MEHENKSFTLDVRRDFKAIQDILVLEIGAALDEMRETGFISFTHDTMLKMKVHTKFNMFLEVLSLPSIVEKFSEKKTDQMVNNLSFLIVKMCMIEEIYNLIGRVVVKLNPRNEKLEQLKIEVESFSGVTVNQLNPQHDITSVEKDWLRIEIDFTGLDFPVEENTVQYELEDDPVSHLKWKELTTKSGDEVRLLC
jgi:hypothetical protein